MRKLIFLTCLMLNCLILTHASLAQDKSLSDIEAMMTAGWYEEANVLLDAYVAVADPDPQALYLKARVNLYLGKLDDAQDWGERSVEADPNQAEYWSQLGTIKAFRVQRSHILAFTLGRSCRKNYEKSLELDRTNLISLQSMMQFYLRAPGIAGGDKDKARQLAEEIYALYPVRGHLARALIYRIADDNMASARREMAAAAAFLTDDPGMWYELGRILTQEGFFADAVDYYKLGIERDPNPATGLLRLGAAYLSQGFLDEAEATYLEILALAPGNPFARVGKGQVLMARGQPEQAIEVFRQLMENQPDFRPNYYFLAAAYNETKAQPEETVRLLQAYLDQYLNLSWPSRALAHWQLALALETLGEYNEAWEAMALALELSGPSDQMKHDAKRLEFMAND